MNNQRKVDHCSPGSGHGTPGQQSSMATVKTASSPSGIAVKGKGMPTSKNRDVDNYVSPVVVSSGTSAPQGGGKARGTGAATKGTRFSGSF